LQALAPTGHSRLIELNATSTGQRESAGFCHADGSDLWISQGAAITPPIHIAFRVSSRAAVDAFYKEAIAAGGRDNGAPGLRPQYHANYYGAFVLDPDGHNIEAVCHEAE
jgi:catechol 2,3-dioxygenase-like lactoylglutathione lyase family enzyme